jgi:hypothetical protein
VLGGVVEGAVGAGVEAGGELAGVDPSLPVEVPGLAGDACPVSTSPINSDFCAGVSSDAFRI